MGRRGSKINISVIKMHHFFVPELMAAAVLVKTIVFDQFLMILVAMARKSTSNKPKCIFFRAGAHGGRRFGQNHRF